MSTQLSAEDSQLTGSSTPEPVIDILPQEANDNLAEISPKSPVMPILPPLPIPTDDPNEALKLLPESSLANRTDLTLDSLDLIFNKAVQLGSGVIELHKVDDNSIVETFKNGVGSVGGSLRLYSNYLTIDPAADLTPGSRYYLSFAEHSIKDINGNGYSEFSAANPLNFATTGIASPSGKLTLLNSPPVIAYDQTTLTLNFDQMVQLGTGQIELHRSSDHSLVETLSVDATAIPENIFANGSSVTLNFKQALAPNSGYYLTMTDQILLDVSGKAFQLPAPESITFATTALPPENLEINSIALFSPGSTASDIQLNFNKELHLNTGEITLHKSADGSVVESFTNGVSPTGGSIYSSKTNSQLTVNPSKDLLPDTQYYFSFADDAFNDQKGSTQILYADSAKLSFTSPGPDQQGPNIVNSGPLYSYSNSVGTLTSYEVAIPFNEAIKLASGDIVLHKASDGSIVETFSQGLGSKEGYISTEYGNLKLVIFTPLESGNAYYISIADNALSDQVGNFFSGVADSNTLQFTVAPPINDSNPESYWTPYLASQDNQIGLPVSTYIFLGFNHEIQLGSGAIILHNADDGSIVETFTQGLGSQGGSVKAEYASVHILPGENLKPATQYYVTVDAGAIVDSQGETFPGFSDANSLNFFTVGPDVLAPIFYPNSNLNHQKDLLPDWPLYFNFNESVQFGNGAIELHKASDNSLVESFKQGVGSAGGLASVSKSSITLDPFADLAQDTEYYLTIADNAIIDLAGNAFSGFTSPDTFNFKTGLDHTAPELTNAVPVNLPPQSNIDLNFSESVEHGGGAITLYKAADNSVVETFTNGTGSRLSKYGNFSHILIPRIYDFG